jgi:cytochrome P450
MSNVWRVEFCMTTVNGDTSPIGGPVYWDPYRPDIGSDPYPIFGRMRDEAPLYYNEEYDFYAVTRFSDVERCLSDRETFSSAKSDILEFIKGGSEVPMGMFIWEDPPVHTAYRNVVTRVFTPRRMNELESKIRAYCTRCLDPLAGMDHFDFIADLGEKLPGGVIGMLLGIPDEDRDAVRGRIEAALRTEVGKPMDVSQASYQGEGYEDYIEWRLKHPSDDLMTELLNAEFQDPTGVKRKLTRDEVLIFVSVLAGAGNETTSRLIGWIGKVLSDHPEQRRQIAADPALVPAAIEEILRFEPPGPAVARYVARDVEIHGKTVPAGSAILLIVAAANRDERRYPDGVRFDIHRQGPPHITFGRGVHSCLGSALARVEGRVALQELLTRFPDWTVDIENAQLSSSSTTRGWDKLPAFTRQR